MTLLLVIRHAATAWNEQGLVQGRTDIPLSPAGRLAAQAWRLPARPQVVRWSASPLRRALETAEALGIDPVIEPRLIEMSWGDWEGCGLTGLRANRQLEPQSEARGLDFRPPNGESPRAVQARLQPWLRSIAATAEPHGAVTHKGVLRALYALAVDWNMRDKPPQKLRDACAHRFRLTPEGAPAVDALNIQLASS